MRVISGLISLMLVSACAQSAPRPDFRAALDAHLSAIAAKDIEAFTPTLTSRDDLMVIFPNGSAIETTQGVVDFHRDWFADDQWRMDPKVVKIIEGDDLSTALLKYDYRDTSDGEPRSSWLVLVFKLEDGAWRLVHDQNTKIIPPAAPAPATNPTDETE
ncbi:MAG: nuclear transport factor 2 family protein [Parvularculaceae bacterium]